MSEREIKATGTELFVINHQPLDEYSRAYAKLYLDNKFPILSDGDQMVSRAYGTVSTFAPSYSVGLAPLEHSAVVPHAQMHRWTYFIDKEGIIRHIDKHPEVMRHGANIVEQIKKLGWK